MNFLAHYYFLENKENPAIIVGNLLPDLFRGFTKIYHQNLNKSDAFKTLDLFKGIQFHLHCDHHFHESTFFKEQCAMLQEKMKLYSLPQVKQYMIAHILLELLIDQHILKENEQIANRFYGALESHSEENFSETLNTYLQIEHANKIFTNFKGFKENKYAYQLQSTEGIQSALYHILGSKIGLNFVDPKWGVMIESGAIELEKELPIFLYEFKKALNNA
jgi:hypothetical protein